MTQTQALRRMFDESGGRLTLGQIMQTYLAASYRARMTDLKRELDAEKKTIVCHQNRKVGRKHETWWEIEELPDPESHYPEPDEQMMIVIR